MKNKTIEILTNAMNGGYAVGAFNTFNLEMTQGIVRAARDLNKPCIIQATPSTFRYAGCQAIGRVVRGVIETESDPGLVGFHLDHGKNLDDVMCAIEEAKMDSVMIDASLMSLEENIRITTRVVKFAHERGVAVQAELGKVPYIGREEQAIDWDKLMTEPEEARELVEKTGVDALAVGIGNAHGFFQERSEPDWERLAKIRELVPNTPLIMHGASDWSKEKIQKAIEIGVSCFNIDTDNRVAFVTSICKSIGPKCDVTDPRKILEPARQAVYEKVKEKIEMFNGLKVEPKDNVGNVNNQTKYSLSDTEE